MARRAEDVYGTAQLLILLADDCALGGEPGRAPGLYREAMAMAQRSGMRREIVLCLEGIALALPPTEAELGVQLVAAACAQLRAVGAEPWPYERARTERWLADARVWTGADGFAAAWREGERLSLEDAVELARGRVEAGSR